eukprot:TRINITY_DN18011_c0_g1_i1.p2 TRINITY_DN18011_c0_g1~~TRINITY_DN18011_c0_g1_i1.p2  ORF type:complete len:133 (+),score=32.60 TRINITY_DN18011_c0_g1_i1:45-401(+)
MAEQGAGSSGASGAAATKELPSIRLTSAEGHEFIVHRDCAMVSGTIKSVFSGPGSFNEQAQNKIAFAEISAPVLEKVVQYFYYKLKYTAPGVNQDIPEFTIEPDIALELLMAANYLDT